jgi:hypothetical protein
VGYTVWDSLMLFRYRAHWGSVGMYAVHHAGSIAAWGLCAGSGKPQRAPTPTQTLTQTLTLALAPALALALALA